MKPTPLGILAILFHLQLNAAVIFEKAPVQGSNFALISRPDNQEAADYFVPSQSASVTAVRWYGSFAPGAPTQAHDYSIRFFKDINGTPANTPMFAATVTRTAQIAFTPPGAQPIYSLGAVLPTPMMLLANERMWISILDMSPESNSEFRWQESRSGAAPFEWASRMTESGTWMTFENSGALAFTLEGTIVPEPPAAWLALVGIVGLGVARLRRR